MTTLSKRRRLGRGRVISDCSGHHIAGQGLGAEERTGKVTCK